MEKKLAAWLTEDETWLIITHRSHELSRAIETNESDTTIERLEEELDSLIDESSKIFDN